MHDPRRSRSERGQVLAIVAGGMIVIVAMVGLVIDGGHAWGRLRIAQNGADATAKGGTVVIQHHLAGVGTQPTDGDVGCAVEAAAAANDVDVEQAQYTDFQGQLLGVNVGPCAPGAGAAIPARAQGVKANAAVEFDTFIMQIIGIGELTARTDATAVVGVPNGLPGGALPTTFPQIGTTCDDPETPFEIREEDGDGLWEPYEFIDEADADMSNLAIVPLCDVSAGSVGWLDYECSPSQNLQQSVDNPCEKFIPIPAWVRTQTGNVNALEDELSQYHGPNVNAVETDDKVVALPVHDNTCSDRPVDTDPTCENLDAEWSGQGNNLYYHIPFWIGFKLNEAYVSGGDRECQTGPGSPALENPEPPGKVGCLKGWFVQRYDGPGPIGLRELTPGEDVSMAVTLIE